MSVADHLSSSVSAAAQSDARSPLHPEDARFMQSLFDERLNALQQMTSTISGLSRMTTTGRLLRATGLVLEAAGLKLPLGATCMVELEDGKSLAATEVVGFTRETLYLMPYEDTAGLVPGARVWSDGATLSRQKVLPVGIGMLGRVVDARGEPLDNKGPLTDVHPVSLSAPILNPLQRAPIKETLDVGVRAINGMLTVGKGQRLGLFAGSGVGKSVLLGMMARFTEADVIVVGLIGERGREVKDFIEEVLGTEGLERAVVVAAPADNSPLLRLQGAAYATRLAEDYRDQGQNVLLIMDSLTRYAMAIREIALAIGEPPATKGYPPSVFARLPALVERAGNDAPGKGTMTAFYTVLTEGDDQQDPIADAARAILDGHVVLDRSLAEAGHYPAIDIEASISRAMTALIDDQHFGNVQYVKQLIARYQRNRDLISVGAYVAGSDPLLDQAIQKYPYIELYLKQGINERADMATSVERLADLRVSSP